MPISSSQGRVVKEILDDPEFKKVKGAKTRFCQIVDKRLKKQGQTLISAINKQQWQDVYNLFTDMRRFIEIKSESCR